MSDVLIPSIPDGWLRIEPVGSRVTCNPPPTDTDRDWLVLVPSIQPETQGDPFFGFAAELSKDGWTLPEPYTPANPDKPQEGGLVFMSVRRGEDNLILTDSEEFFRRFLAATSVAKRLNLLDKADRIALFQAVLYGNACEAIGVAELEELFV